MAVSIRMQRWWTWMVIALVLGPVHATAATTSVTVRVYDANEDADHVRQRDEALDDAARLLKTGGIGVEWRRCPLGSKACDRPPERGEVLLRFAYESPEHLGGRLPTVLGDAIVDGPAGRLATIYVDRVRVVSEYTERRAAVIMSRVIAHEIAHVLMGEHDHSARGLMRARWSWKELVENTPGDWLFTLADRAALAGAMAGRR